MVCKNDLEQWRTFSCWGEGGGGEITRPLESEAKLQ